MTDLSLNLTSPIRPYSICRGGVPTGRYFHTLEDARKHLCGPRSQGSEIYRLDRKIFPKGD